MDIQRAFTKCGIYSTSWRRVAHIDMTDPATRCPSGLRIKASSSATKQRACGRRKDRGCSSLMYHIEGNYSHVCGRVRGYQFGETEAFSDTNINSSYADGVLITHGIPRRHLWTYTAGTFETHIHSCPCFPMASSDMPSPPHFVKNDYYCESGFVSNHVDRIACMHTYVYISQHCEACTLWQQTLEGLCTRCNAQRDDTTVDTCQTAHTHARTRTHTHADTSSFSLPNLRA